MATLERCRQVDVESEGKVKEIEDKIKNSKALKEKELKSAHVELEKCKKKAEQTRSKWNLKKQVRKRLYFQMGFYFRFMSILVERERGKENVLFKKLR